MESPKVQKVSHWLSKHGLNHQPDTSFPRPSLNAAGSHPGSDPYLGRCFLIRRPISVGRCRERRLLEKITGKEVDGSIPRDPITLSDDDWGVQSPPQQGI